MLIKHLAFSALSCASALACSSGPLGINEARLEFSAERLAITESDPAVTVEVDEASGLLQVQGVVVLPCMGRGPRGSLLHVGSLVVLTIYVEKESTCATVPAIWGHTSLISNLKPGQYTLRVVQPVPDFTIPSYPSEIVFEQVIELP